MTINDAYKLADMICIGHARELALESRRYKRDPEWYYDPLTMVCLAELIFQVSEKGFPYAQQKHTGRRTKKSRTTQHGD